MIRQSRRREALRASLNRFATQMVQGSLVTLRGPCGKASCACARSQDQAHRRQYLSWTEAGRTHMLYLPQARLGKFRKGIRAWRKFKALAKALAQLNAQILKATGGGKEARAR